MPVRFCVRKILDVDVYFRVTVHVEDTLIGPAKHGRYVPGSLAVVSIHSVKTALCVGKTKVADQPLRHAVRLKPCDRCILGFCLQAFEPLDPPDSEILVIGSAVSSVGLFEEGRYRPLVIAIRNVIGGSQAELTLRGNRAYRMVWGVQNCGLSYFNLPVPVGESLRKSKTQQGFAIAIGVVVGWRFVPVPPNPTCPFIDKNCDGMANGGRRRSGRRCLRS